MLLVTYGCYLICFCVLGITLFFFVLLVTFRYNCLCKHFVEKSIGIMTFIDVSKVPAECAELAGVFAEHGFDVFLVGGAVRDMLASKTPHDWDFTTNATVADMKTILSSWADSVFAPGEAFGTVCAVKSGMDFEVTSFRSESADVSLEGDLVRRDLSMNAMACDVLTGELFDFFGGVRSLVSGVLDTPGDPVVSFSDDPLRMLRVARFVAKTNFGVAPRVVEAMRSCAKRLSIVSAERVRGELVKLIEGDFPVAGLRLLDDTSLLGLVLPELVALKMNDRVCRYQVIFYVSYTQL